MRGKGVEKSTGAGSRPIRVAECTGTIRGVLCACGFPASEELSLAESKIAALVLRWVEDSVDRSDSPDSGVGGSFS